MQHFSRNLRKFILDAVHFQSSQNVHIICKTFLESSEYLDQMQNISSVFRMFVSDATPTQISQKISQMQHISRDIAMFISDATHYQSSHYVCVKCNTYLDFSENLSDAAHFQSTQCLYKMGHISRVQHISRILKSLSQIQSISRILRMSSTFSYLSTSVD